MDFCSENEANKSLFIHVHKVFSYKIWLLYTVQYWMDKVFPAFVAYIKQIQWRLSDDSWKGIMTYQRLEDGQVITIVCDGRCAMCHPSGHYIELEYTGGDGKWGVSTKYEQVSGV